MEEILAMQVGLNVDQQVQSHCVCESQSDEARKIFKVSNALLKSKDYEFNYIWIRNSPTLIRNHQNIRAVAVTYLP